jgi:hypothetical protein
MLYFFQYAIRVANTLTQTSFLSNTPHSESTSLFLNFRQTLHFTTVVGGKNKFVSDVYFKVIYQLAYPINKLQQQ